MKNINSLVQTTIQIDKPSLATSRVTFRKWKDIDKDALLQDHKNAVEKLQLSILLRISPGNIILVFKILQILMLLLRTG